jgi:hypothetical protein
MNGRMDWLFLLTFYGGLGNMAKMISKAEARMNRTLHYKKESTMSFEKFVNKLKEMFNIFAKHGEPITEKAKIRQLLDKVTASEMQIPPRKYAWSPDLRKAGLLLRYWKFCLADFYQESDSYRTHASIQQRLQQHDR